MTFLFPLMLRLKVKDVDAFDVSHGLSPFSFPPSPFMKISLSNLEFYAFHGVLEQERTVGGGYLADIALDVNVTATAYNHDELSGTVNYAQVYEAVKAEMMVPSKLLEHVVMRIARRLLDEFSLVRQVEISLTKVNPPMGASCKGASVKLCLSKLDERYINRE